MFYDPYMIEFLIRNDILEGIGNRNNDYMYIDHKIEPIKTFALDYNRTFFKCVEDRDMYSLQKAKIDSTADYIDDFGSIFAQRAENYFRMNYSVPTYDAISAPMVFHNVMETFPKSILPKILKKDLYTKAEIAMNPVFGIYNVFIKFFNNVLINEDDYHNLERMDFEDSIQNFYLIPILIFCLEKFEKEMLETNPYNDFKIGEIPSK